MRSKPVSANTPLFEPSASVHAELVALGILHDDAKVIRTLGHRWPGRRDGQSWPRAPAGENGQSGSMEVGDYVWLALSGVLLIGFVAVVGYGGQALMRRDPRFGLWRYRLRRAMHVREDTTDLVVKDALGLE